MKILQNPKIFIFSSLFSNISKELESKYKNLNK